jgi:hypothetical protein
MNERYCSGCRHYQEMPPLPVIVRVLAFQPKITRLCGAPQNRNPVTGDVDMVCGWARRDRSNPCGPEGYLWEER